MENIFLKSIPTGALQVNCIILACENTKDAAVIDPGGNEDEIISILKNNDLNLTQIIHTHAHFDHCLGSAEVYNYSGGSAEVYLHKEDYPLYKNMKEQAMQFSIETSEDAPPVTIFINDNDIITLGNLSIKVLHTPGHSPGSCSLYLEQGNLLISGDTLFAGSIGRTDLWKGDQQELLKNIKEKLYTLPDNTKVIPGHGPYTNIGIEKQSNPYTA